MSCAFLSDRVDRLGDLGIPQLAAIRGFHTPNIDRMAREGAMFTRMYTEPACTPSRAAVITGRHPVRNGMGAVDWPLIFGGLGGDEVTTAEVLSNAGYATAFYAKWHLGDIPESYCHNQGFDWSSSSFQCRILSELPRQ